MPTPSARRGSGPALRVERLEDRTVPSFSPFQASGGESIAVGDVLPEVVGPAQNEYVVGNGPGQLPYVRIYNLNGTLEAQFLAYEPTYTGGVNVAVGDVVTGNGNTLSEIITGTGPGGGPLVKVFNPSGGGLVRQFLAYESSFRGGVNVATGQLDASSPGEEILTGSGYGGGPVVRVFSGAGAALVSFFAYESSFRNGVNVAAGDVIPTSAGEEIVTGPGEGGAPLLKVFSNRGVLQRSYFAFDIADRNGLVVAVGTTAGAAATASTGEQIFAAAQFTPLTTAPRVRGFAGTSTGQVSSDFNPFPAGYTRYINFAVGDVVIYPNNLQNSGDWVGVAGEGQISQTPRVQYGQVGYVAGKNGP